MSEEKTPPTEKVYPAELKDLFERGNAGDTSVLPELQKAFDEYPEFAGMLGDLVKHAEQGLLLLAAGKSLTAQEAMRRRVAALREELALDAATPLERLLVDRVCVTWLDVYEADMAAAHHLRTSGGAAPVNQAAQRRLDRAQARHLAAVKALAVLKKLVRPALSPLDLASHQVPETPGDAAAGWRARTSDVAQGVPVAN